jgi:DNA-directed RNA polymerase II subunit RPB1
MAKTQGHARKRIAHVYELCKGKKMCEGGDEVDEKLDGALGDGEGKKVMVLN